MLNILWKIEGFSFQIWQNRIEKFKRTTKSCREIIFVSATKVGENTNNILNYYNFNLNSHFGISNQISACRKLNVLLTNSLCLVVFSLEMQRRLIQTISTLQFFLHCHKRKASQTFKSSSCIKLFRIKPFLQCVSYRYNLLR